jgi:hypothetical protein
MEKESTKLINLNASKFKIRGFRVSDLPVRSCKISTVTAHTTHCRILRDGMLHQLDTGVYSCWK